MFLRSTTAALIGFVSLSAIGSAADVTPSNATATFSQGGFPFPNVIDTDPTGTGWAGDGGGGTAIPSTGVLESATHLVVAPAANALSFNLNFGSGFGDHNLGKFRLYATNDRGPLSSGATTGTAPGRWWLIQPTTAVAASGATLTINPDGSILATDINTANDTYTVTAPVPLVGITGIRIDTLNDPSLPGNQGPGLAGNGNFVMTDFSIDSSARVGLQNATATQSQGGFSIANTIDGVSNNTGWAFSSAPSTGAFETVSDVGVAGGTKIQFGIDHRFGANHDLSNAKFYVTNADRSQFADGLANGGDIGVSGIWTEVTPLRATSEGGALVSIGGDNRVTFGGFNPATDTYTIQAISPISNITGLKIDVAGTPGRAGNGNAVVSEISFDAVPTQLVGLTNATATYNQSGFEVTNTIDGVSTNANNGWAVDGTVGDRTAVFQTTAPLSTETLTFTLAQNYGGLHVLGKFHLYATSDLNPSISNLGSTNWVDITPGLVFTDNATGYSVLGNTITVNGLANVDRYTVMAHAPLQNITGFRLDALGFNLGRPGGASNGNFVLNEFIVEASSAVLVPEPSGLTLLALGSVLMFWFGKRNK